MEYDTSVNWFRDEVTIVPDVEDDQARLSIGVQFQGYFPGGPSLTWRAIHANDFRFQTDEVIQSLTGQIQRNMAGEWGNWKLKNFYLMEPFPIGGRTSGDWYILDNPL